MLTYHKEDFRPARLLVENIGLLPTGRVLDLAMGMGRNALYLAKRGFDVEGVDISSEAVRSTLAQAQEARINLSARVADLERDYCIEKGAYDVIICFNYLQRSLIPHIKDGLRTGGVVLYETFTVDQARFGRPKNPEYLLKHNELLDLFRDFLCIFYREGIVDGVKAVASIIAKKVQTTEIF